MRFILARSFKALGAGEVTLNGMTSRTTSLAPGAFVQRLRAKVFFFGGMLLATTGCASAPSYRMEFPSQAAASIQPTGAVLMVLSAAPVQTLADGSRRETGYFLNEFYEPYRHLVDEGYEVAIATPGGRAPALDPESLNEKYWRGPEELQRARELVRAIPAMRRPLALEDVAKRASDYQGLVVPGGQGVMVDLLDEPHLHRLIRELAASHRPVGLICHAPAILTRMERDTATLAGRRVTSVSAMEEWYIESFVMGADAQVRGIGERLDGAGFRHEAAFAGSSHAVRDCNLVTSQNPFSGDPFGRQFLAALRDFRRGGQCVPNRQD